MEPDVILKGLIAKLQSVEEMVSGMYGIMQDIQQRQKHLQYTIAKGQDPDAHVPKGESNTVLCEECGSRTHVKDAMKKMRDIDDKVVAFTICRKCFYNKR